MITLGLAARLATEKGVEYLFEAIKDVDCKLLIAGSLNPVGEQEYKTKIFELVGKVRNKVEFLGEIDPKKMPEFYKQIDILVLPSVNSTESFGMVQVEAMMCGIPVIASNLPGVRVPIETTGYGIVVSPKNSKEIASAILEITKNRNKYLPDPKKVGGIFNLQKTVSFYEDLAK